jgi:hypothetical protein
MDGVPMEIVKRHFHGADPDYGIGVAIRMGLSMIDLLAAEAWRHGPAFRCKHELTYAILTEYGAPPNSNFE